MNTIKPGAKTPEVKTLQETLNKFGYKLQIDGIFGTKTLLAVTDFQKKHNLSVDGIVGPKTWSKLGWQTSEADKSSRYINMIIIHCSATKENQDCTHLAINATHRARKFSSYIDPKTGQTMYIGYHFYIRKDGTVVECRPVKIRGCHTPNFNANSIGICYEGGLDAADTNGTKIKDTRTPQQKAAIISLIKSLKTEYPEIKSVIGHRDTSPDLNGNGIIEPFEYIKGCPCFDAIPEYKHLI